jgi:hypothetical protein
MQTTRLFGVLNGVSKFETPFKTPFKAGFDSYGGSRQDLSCTFPVLHRLPVAQVVFPGPRGRYTVPAVFLGALTN